MVGKIEMLRDRMELGISAYRLFVVIETESKWCFGFSYVVAMGTDTTKDKINDIDRITIEGAWV